MKTGASRGAGGEGLYAHWIDPKNEAVEPLPGRHLAAETLLEQVRELTAATGHARTRTPVYHIWVAPDPGERPPTTAEMADLWQRVEWEFNLVAQPFVEVAHVKTRNGRHHPQWREDRHWHRAYSLVDEDGRMVDGLRHDYIRRERICAEWEHDHGFAITPLKHARAVLSWLDRHRPEVAAALRAAGYDGWEPTRIAEIQPDARDRAGRAAFTPRDLHAVLLACWRSTESAAWFAAALAQYDLRLAMGTRVPVVLDEQGIAHPLRRTLAAAARAREGRGITAAAIEARLHGYALASADDARRASHERRREQHHEHGEAAYVGEHQHDNSQAFGP
jgi:hypothetical protein